MQTHVLWAVFLYLISPVILFRATPLADADTTTYQLSPGNPKVISLHHHHAATLKLIRVSPMSRFIIIQVYTQHATLMLTQTSPLPGGTETGSSVGMVQMMSSSTGDMTWMISVVKGSMDDDDFPVSVLAVVQEYADNVPVPGACNQVFALETDPNIRVIPAEYHSQVWFQWANVGTVKPLSCDSEGDKGRLSYEVFVAYPAETDASTEGLFDTIRSIMTVHGMQSKAMKVSTIENDGRHKSLVKVISQRGQGAVYGVVVTDTHSGLAASYVASVSYACNYTADDCSLQHDVLEWVMLAACAVTGLFLLLLGHHFFKTEMVVMGFVATTLVSFILLSMAHMLSDPVRLGIAAGLGVVGGGGWLLLWVAFTFPSVSILLPGLCAGFLVAGALFITPFANIIWWDTSVDYGMVLLCATLLFGVLFLCSPRTLNILSCSLVGGYCVTMVAAIPLRSSLRLIVLNVIRHASVSNYATVVVVFPFLLNDIILTAVWGTLAAAGVGWQFYRARGQPHFPHQPPPLRSQGQGQRQNRVIRKPPSDEENERAALLGNDGPPPSYYESVNHGPSAPETNRPM